MLSRNHLLRAAAAVAATPLLRSGAYAVPTAHAQTVEPPCQELISDLEAEVTTVPLTGRNADKDRAGLLSKRGDASAKLEQGKPDDAIRKLVDFQTRVEQLAAAGSLPAENAAALLADADAAIACIEDQA